MAYQTPWTQRHSAGSLPSDRLKPSRPNSSQSQSNNSSKGKGGKDQAQNEPSKSRQVRQLEGLLSALRQSLSSPKKDQKGGCFCQARKHPLSPYTPICRTCALPLCNLNQPSFSCPHCSSSLTPTPALHESLVSRIERELSDIIGKEVAERERAIEEARRIAGAFPSLSGGNTSSLGPGTAVAVSQTHKVISLGGTKGSGGKTKGKNKVTISSYTTTPATSRSVSRAETDDEEEAAGVIRVPPPPTEIRFVEGGIDPERPWANLRVADGERGVYIPIDTKAEEQREGKEKENQDGEKNT
ncbi:hypothetical protein D9757_014011 [Collybiopsis confluens]|uniref:TRIP4/RQT4 C2HC5-type zinc finger domain-containing protein n=1 Tax=Collybiopsis confluens TaxID=2823264 RepID=A0A8H5FZN1_9AGAR|nr:hypothetical protein D9757_014011 [Collybiopsis confluens]